MLPRLIVAFLAPLLALVPANAEPVHGIALYGTPKQPPGFAHFSYVDLHAPKGGASSSAPSAPSTVSTR
ncbi:MAG: hypothetical protein M5U07_02500 [Xanthobacteraceae bacterium]|nr:hypothetical protein [Xanthobacteraceae bacterium]